MATAALALWAPLAAAATPGDSQAEPLLLAGPLPIEVSASNLGATNDPAPAVDTFAAGHSVWFKWEATTSGWISIGACQADFSPVVGIFEEDGLGFFVPAVLRTNTNEGPDCMLSGGRQFTFRATDGKRYLIGVDGNGYVAPFPPGYQQPPPPLTEGSFTLRIAPPPPPANDDFAAAAPIVGKISEEPNGARFYFAQADGYNWGATVQAGEPDDSGVASGASVWYSWTAPESGAAIIGTCCAGAVIDVYIGSSLGSLVGVASNPSSGGAYLEVSAGTTYRIAVDGRHDPSSLETMMLSFRLQVSMRLAPGPGQRAAVPTTPPHPPRSMSPPPPAISRPPRTRPPRTILIRRRVDRDARSATFVFKSSAPGSRYRCKLDRGRYQPCRSPRTYRHLSGGRHVFRAVAVSAAGIADPTPLVARLSLPKR